MWDDKLDLDTHQRIAALHATARVFMAAPCLLPPPCGRGERVAEAAKCCANAYGLEIATPQRRKSFPKSPFQQYVRWVWQAIHIQRLTSGLLITTLKLKTIILAILGSTLPFLAGRLCGGTGSTIRNRSKSRFFEAVARVGN